MVGITWVKGPADNVTRGKTALIMRNFSPLLSRFRARLRHRTVDISTSGSIRRLLVLAYRTEINADISKPTHGKRYMYTGIGWSPTDLTDPEFSLLQHRFSPFAHRFSSSWDHLTCSKTAQIQCRVVCN